MNNEKCVDIIYIYFSKAFDVVSHEKIVYKLKSYGISIKIIKSFHNILSNISQITRVENYCSNSSIVKSGVPQGSVLDAILCLLNINDIPSIFHHKLLFIYLPKIQTNSILTYLIIKCFFYKII